MTESLNIYQRLHKVMQAVSYVQKESKRVNNQYTFVSHDAVTAALRPALIEHGILPVTRVLRHSQDGNRTEVDIQVEFVNIDSPDDRLLVTAFGYGVDPQDKGPGKAVSYAFKYACLKTFALETGDDPEKDSIDHEPAYINELDDAAQLGVEAFRKAWHDIPKAERAPLRQRVKAWQEIAEAADKNFLAEQEYSAEGRDNADA